jgi:hypothetical protein
MLLQLVRKHVANACIRNTPATRMRIIAAVACVSTITAAVLQGTCCMNVSVAAGYMRNKKFIKVRNL